MKAEAPDPLDSLLAQWQTQVESPPDSRKEVWRRIAVENCEPGWMERLASRILRPKYEAFAFAAAILSAFAWGMAHPPEPLNPRDAYVLSISPFDPSHWEGGRP